MVSRSDITKRRDEIISIARKYGASNLRIFGSVARDDSSPSSDLDILVTMDAARSLVDRIAMTQEIEELLHCKVDVVNDRALNSSIRDNVLEEAMPL